MSNLQENMVAKKPSDEMDLIGLINILWKKKLLIIFSSVFFMIISGIYVFTATERWTSSANIISPRNTELGSLLNMRHQYAEIIGDSEFNGGKLSAELYGMFKHLLLSNDLKENFFKQSDWFKRQVENKKLNEKQTREYLADLLDKYLVITKPDNKSKEDTELDDVGLYVSFTAETPEEAQGVLEAYVDYVNAAVLEQLNKEFHIRLKLRIDNLTFEKEKITANLEKVKKVQVENLTKALEIAKDAGVSNFAKNIANNSIPEYLLGDARIKLSDSKLNDDNYLFMLGEKYLKAQLETVKNTELVYPLEYYSMERQLALLKPLSSVKEDNQVKTYRYLASPDYPPKRDWPKRALILVGGLVLGGLLGSIIALFGTILHSRKEKN